MKRFFFLICLFILSSSLVFADELTAFFSDLEPGSWYEEAVIDLNQKGIIKGYEDATFKPSKTVNRAELSVILSRLLAFLSHPEGKEPWQQYINEEFDFTIEYPPKWTVLPISESAIGFRPPHMQENKVQWAVLIKDYDLTTFEKIIEDMGSQFPSTRGESRQSLKLNGKEEATHVIVTTTEKPTWRHEQILVKHFNKLYVVTNGAIENNDFELFWRSLKFLEPKL